MSTDHIPYQPLGLDHRPAPARRHLVLYSVGVLLVAIVLGALAGFFASGLHPGPRGVQGAAGKQGVAGTAGLQGPAGVSGAAAKIPANLGVCYSSGFANLTDGTSVTTYVNITSPSKHADGTTYCPSGDYVPVTPAADNSAVANSPQN